MPTHSTILPKLFLKNNNVGLSFVGYAFLFILCCAFYIPGIVSLPPTDRDESLFAQASKQMIETHDFVDIRFQEDPRYKKPIGIYWLQTSIVSLLNSGHLNEIWAYRIPSFLGASVSVLLTAALGSLIFGAETGFLAALLLACSILLNVEARLAKTDAALLASVLFLEYALAKAYFVGERRLLNLFVFWSALAVGILIKGPIIVLVLFSTLLGLFYKERNLKWFLSNLKPQFGILYLLILVAPWFVAILVYSHGTFFTQSAGNDFLAKIWQGQNRGVMLPGMHLAAFPLVFFPGSLFVLLSILDIWKSRQEKTVYYFLSWLVPTWIIFEITLTKLPHYVLPTYPAVAILTAQALVKGFPYLRKSKHIQLITFFSATLFIVLGTGLCLLFVFLPTLLSSGNPNTVVLCASLVFLFSQFATLALFTRQNKSSLIVLTIGSLVFYGSIFSVALPSIKALWVSDTIVKVAQEYSHCANPEIISVSYHEPSLVFLAGTQTKLLYDGKSAAEELNLNPCSLVVLDDKNKVEFNSAYLNNPVKPIVFTTIDGFNMGRGQKVFLTMYGLPKKGSPP